MTTPSKAAIRPADPCPFCRIPCEYVPLAYDAERLREENTILRAALDAAGLTVVRKEENESAR